MSNPNKAKGGRFELDLERALRDLGLVAARPRQTGNVDVGDLHIEHDIVGQAKNFADVATALRLGVEGAERQAVAAGRPFGVAVVKRRGKNAGEAWVAMSLSTFARLLRRGSSS